MGPCRGVGSYNWEVRHSVAVIAFMDHVTSLPPLYTVYKYVTSLYLLTVFCVRTGHTACWACGSGRRISAEESKSQRNVRKW